MKVRIGYGLGVRTHLNDTSFFDVVDALEDLKFDSLWVSERIGAEAPDPVVAMSVAAARTKKLKFGMSVMVLPGRNPVLLAKQLATLDRMSNGRLLPAFGFIFKNFSKIFNQKWRANKIMTSKFNYLLYPFYYH
jgi:alkanesulfonate monooxygenase SsuD/methylene tetrahydromethanopterin reductase-like flavin-dependent oxidoreductase (luciferase family)